MNYIPNFEFPFLSVATFWERVSSKSQFEWVVESSKFRTFGSGKFCLSLKVEYVGYQGNEITSTFSELFPFVSSMTFCNGSVELILIIKPVPSGFMSTAGGQRIRNVYLYDCGVEISTMLSFSVSSVVSETGRW